MAEDLSGKYALVTAASEGLGFAIASRIAEAGATLAICARREPELTRSAETITSRTGRRVVPFVADLAQATDVQRLTADVLGALSAIDILVVNSGHISYGGIDTLSDDDWYSAFDLLVMSAVRLVRAVIPSMRARGGGAIVFVGSSSVRNPPPHLLLSSVMRLGVAGLAKTLARSLAPENIRVNVVAPGYFETGRVRARIAENVRTGTSPEEARRAIAGDQPMGRLGDANELAELVLFLVGDRAPFLTGSHIPIDGGVTGYPL